MRVRYAPFGCLLATTFLDVREWLAGSRPSHSTIGPGHCSALAWDSSARGSSCIWADCSRINRKCLGIVYSGRVMDSRCGCARCGRTGVDLVNRHGRCVCSNYSGGTRRHVGDDRSRRLVDRCPAFRKKVYRWLIEGPLPHSVPQKVGKSGTPSNE